MNVLIIDDNRALTDSLSNYLSNHYMVCVAENYCDGKNMLETIQPDLLLLDLDLPDRYGIELCNTPNALHQPIPTIILSAQSHPHRIASAIEQGAEEYLTKPCSPLVLLAKMRQVLSRKYRKESPSHTHTASVIACPELDLTLHTKTRELIHAEAHTHLTPSETTLCRLFLSHPRHTHSKSALIEALHPTATPALLYTHLRNLRKKLQSISPYTVCAAYNAGFVLRKGGK